MKTPASSSEQEEATPPENTPIRQSLLPLCAYHEEIDARGISETTAHELGIGYLAQGRSPLRGRIVFQLRDARPSKKNPSQLEPVILTHLGRRLKEAKGPKYLYYEGFHKSLEILGQDRLWLYPLAAEQIQATGYIVLTEGPFDWAKTLEAGLHNVGACLGSAMSNAQATKIKALADHYGINRTMLAFDRDQAGQEGADKAQEKLTALGLEVSLFDWDRIVGRINGEPARIPDTIQDLADFTPEQLTWLRGKGWL